jgi:hypothetical protein
MCKECSPQRAERVAKMERQAAALGDLQKFVVDGPLIPLVAATGLVVGSSVVDSVVDLLLR